MSYTPKPWKSVNCLDDGIYVVKDTKEWFPLADIRCINVPAKEVIGNACLMAAAPEMREWMEAVIRAFCEDEISALDELNEKKVAELFDKGADILQRINDARYMK